MSKLKKTAVLIAVLGLLVAVPAAAGDNMRPTRSETGNVVEEDHPMSPVVKHVPHRDRYSPRWHRHEWREHHVPDHGWHYYPPYRDYYPRRYYYRGHDFGHYYGTPRFGYRDFGYGHGGVRVGPLQIWW